MVAGLLPKCANERPCPVRREGPPERAVPVVSGLDWCYGPLTKQKQNSSMAVPRGEKVQSVVHVVVAAHNGSIDPRPLDYLELPGSGQKFPAVFVGDDGSGKLLPVNRIANEPPGMW